MIGIGNEKDSSREQQNNITHQFRDTSDEPDRTRPKRCYENGYVPSTQLAPDPVDDVHSDFPF